MKTRVENKPLPSEENHAHTRISVSPFYTFSEHQPKDVEDKVCMYHSWIFQTNCKFFVCAKEKQETKRDVSPGWPQNLAEQSSGNNLLNSRILALPDLGGGGGRLEPTRVGNS